MKTILELDTALVEQARELTHIQDKADLIHEALRALIAQYAQRRLAQLGGRISNLKMPRRRNDDSHK